MDNGITIIVVVTCTTNGGLIQIMASIIIQPTRPNKLLVGVANFGECVIIVYSNAGSAETHRLNSSSCSGLLWSIFTGNLQLSER